MKTPFQTSRQSKQKIIAFYYNPDFIQNIKNLMGGYNRYLTLGRDQVFTAYWIFEHVVFLCKLDDKKRIPITKEMYDKFIFLMRGIEDEKDIFVFDKKSSKYDFVPLLKLTRHEKYLRETEEEELSETPKQKNYITGFLYKDNNELIQTTELDIYEYNNLLDLITFRLKEVAVEIELIVQRELSAQGYGYEEDSEFEVEDELS